MVPRESGSAAVSPKDAHRIRLFVHVRTSLHEMGFCVLELLRHPDSTMEQIETARNLYRDAYNRFEDGRRKLQTHYPQMYFPWNQRN